MMSAGGHSALEKKSQRGHLSLLTCHFLFACGQQMTNDK
jgi:hypothetical protein